MKKRLTRAIFFALIAIAFYPLFFDSSANASTIPQEVRNELNSRCSPGPFYQNKMDENGNIYSEWFDTYSGNNNHMSTNYATVKDSQGRDRLISSLTHKEDFVISDNTEITVHYVTAGCPGKPAHSTRLTNVKILNDAGSAKFRDVFNVSPSNAIGGWGEGQQLNNITISGGQYAETGQFKITLKSDYRSKLKTGRNVISVKAAHCIAAPNQGNYPASVEPNTYLCMYVDFQLSVIKPGDYQTDARSSIKVQKSDGTVPAEWGTPGRTINAQPGETLYFQHTIESITGSNNTGTRPLNLIVRANDDYVKAFKDSKIVDNKLQSQDLKANKDPSQDSSYELFELSGVVKQNTGTFFRASAEGVTGGGTQSYQTYKVKSEDRGKLFCQWLEFNNHTSPGKPYKSTPYQTLHSNINVSVTNMACAYIPYDNDPIPPNVVAGGGNASGGSSTEVEAGTPQVPVSAHVVKPDGTTQTKPIEWKLTHFVVKPNQAIPGVGGTGPKDENGNPLSGGFVSEYGVDPCATNIYNTAAVYNTVDTSKRIQRCQTIANGTITNLDSTKTIDIPSLGMSDPLNKFSVPESAEVGTKYCFALSISPYMMSKDWDKARQDSFKKWYHGKPGCIIVVKKPKTQFLGGGIYAGSGVVASQSTRVTAYSRSTGPQSTSTSNVERKFGSWVEYELVVNRGTNNGLATNGIFGPTMVGIADPNQAVTGIAGRTTKDVKFQNRLTLANSDSDYGNFGGTNYAQAFFNRMKSHYQAQVSASKMVSYNPAQPITPGGSYYSANRDINLNLSYEVITGDTTVIYAPNNTVTISGNIQNTNVNVRSVGQTIIIAKNINIDQSVTRVDAWLLASDSIDTCKVTGSLSSTVCNNHLLVNGPVVVASDEANGLKLNRTAGSEGDGDGIGNPGETFLLGYDAYQWIVNQANVGGVRITTSYTKELPVRY